jgi:hypothetical protein
MSVVATLSVWLPFNISNTSLILTFYERHVILAANLGFPTYRQQLDASDSELEATPAPRFMEG